MTQRSSTFPESNNCEESNAKTVKFTRLPTAPSIPVPTQSFGYDENLNGELVQRLPPKEIYSGTNKDTVGPAYYAVGYGGFVFLSILSYLQIKILVTLNNTLFTVEYDFYTVASCHHLHSTQIPEKSPKTPQTKVFTRVVVEIFCKFGEKVRANFMRKSCLKCNFRG